MLPISSARVVAVRGVSTGILRCARHRRYGTTVCALSRAARLARCARRGRCHHARMRAAAVPWQGEWVRIYFSFFFSFSFCVGYFFFCVSGLVSFFLVPFLISVRVLFLVFFFCTCRGRHSAVPRCTAVQTARKRSVAHNHFGLSLHDVSLSGDRNARIVPNTNLFYVARMGSPHAIWVFLSFRSGSRPNGRRALIRYASRIKKNEIDPDLRGLFVVAFADGVCGRPPAARVPIAVFTIIFMYAVARTTQVEMVHVGSGTSAAGREGKKKNERGTGRGEKERMDGAAHRRHKQTQGMARGSAHGRHRRMEGEHIPLPVYGRTTAEIKAARREREK